MANFGFLLQFGSSKFRNFLPLFLDFPFSFLIFEKLQFHGIFMTVFLNEWKIALKAYLKSLRKIRVLKQGVDGYSSFRVNTEHLAGQMHLQLV